MTLPTVHGDRGVALIFAAAYCFVRFIAYLPGNEPTTLPGALQLVSSFIPLAVWSTIWLLTGLLCTVAAFRPQLDPWGWGAWMGVTTIWGLSYLAAWGISIFGPDPASREYLNASTYILPVLIVWKLLRQKSAPVIVLKEA